MDFRPVGGNKRVTAYQTAASQTIEVGDPVAFDAAGQIVIGTALLAEYVGIAASAVTSSSAGDAISVWDSPDLQFLVTADAAVTQTMVDQDCDIVVSGGGQFQADVGATAKNVLRVVDDYQNRDELAADTQAVCRFALHALNG